MAKYNITSLNYMASGPKRCYINVDTVLDYMLSDYTYVLDTEGHLSGNIRTEQGDYNVIDTQYFQYEDGKYKDEAIAQEKSIQDLLIPEEITNVEETNSENGRLILLKQSDNADEYLSQLKKFNRERFEWNRTFVIPFLDENEKDESIANILDCDKGNSEINPMYEIKDVCIKSSLKKGKRNTKFKMTDDDIDIYAPQMTDNPIQFCQTNNNAFMLDTYRANDVHYLRVETDSNNNGTYINQMKGNSIDTIMYTPIDKLSVSTLVEDYDEYGNKIGEHTEISVCESYAHYLSSVGTDGIEDIFEDYTHANGMKRNLIYSLDQKTHDTDYRNGNVPADYIMMGKNAYNSTYSIDFDISDSINDTREYCGIGYASGNIFVKYYDGIKYKCVDKTEDENGKTLQMEQDSSNVYNYQKVEYLSPLKTSNKAKHKSNMFSVSLENTAIENLVSEEDDQYEKLKNIQDSIKMDITNAINNIVENVCPVNTQLFNVYFED